MTTSQGWRDIQRFRQSRIRQAKRIFVFVILMALVGWFVLLLTAPFRHPNTHLVYAVGGGDARQSVGTPPFALEQYAHLTPLKAALYRGDDASGSLSLVTPADIGGQSWLSSQGASVGVSDAVVVFVAASEVRNDAGVGLRPGGFADTGQDLAVDRVIERVRQMPGKTKLLVLDMTTPLTPGDGLLLPDTLATELAGAVRRTKDSSLWVMTSHGVFEQSQQSLALKRTVFGYFVARGLKGDADLDGDRVITMGELLAYVRAGVGRWAEWATDGHSSQTPLLLWGGGNPRLADVSVPILSVVKLPTEQRELDIQQAISDARVPASEGKWENVFRERMANRMLPVTNPIRDKLTEARVPELVAAAEGTGATKDSPESATGAPPGSVGDVGAGGETAAGLENAAKNGASDGFVLPIDPLVQASLVDRLGRAWLIHDRLLEATDRSPRPIDYAPNLWREFQQQLLVVDQAVRSGWTFDTKPLARVLDEQFLSMEVLLSPGRPASPPVAGETNRWVDRFRSRWPGFRSSTGLHSVAILDRSGVLAERFSEESLGAIKAYDSLLTTGTAADFAAWYEKSWNAEFESLAEFRCVTRFADRAASEWAITQRLFRARRVGERAAVAVASRDSMKDSLLRADQFRRDGERLFDERLGEGWRQSATTRLIEAEDLYVRILETEKARLRVEALFHDLTNGLPYYVALHRVGRSHPDQPFPSAGDIDDLFNGLSSAIVVIGDGASGDGVNGAGQGPASLGELRAIGDNLSNIAGRLRPFTDSNQVNRLVGGGVRSSDAWFVRTVLATPLVPTESRMRLIAAASEIEAVSLRDETFSAVVEDARSYLSGLRPKDDLEDPRRSARLAELRRESTDWARWQSAVFSIGDFEAPVDQRIVDVAVRRQIDRWDGASIGLTAFVGDYERLRGTVAADRLQWGVRLAGLKDRSLDLSEPPSRGSRISALKRAERWTRLVATGLGGPFDPAMVGERLASARRYDVAQWLASRDRIAMEDLSASRRGQMVLVVRDYDSISRSEPLQPAPVAGSVSVVELVGASEVVFGPEQSTAVSEVTLHNRSGESVDVWLVLASDRRFLEIDSDAGENVYREDELRLRLGELAEDAEDDRLRLMGGKADAAGDADTQNELADRRRLANERAERLKVAAVYPYRPDVADLPATVRLAAGQAKTITVNLRRNAPESRDTKWVVSAISAGSHSRWDTDVRLPDRSAIRLGVEGGDGSWGDGDGDGDTGLRLMPYPNRPTPYRITLSNHRGSDLAAMVRVLAPERAIEIAVPETMLSSSAAAEWLGRVGSSAEVLPPMVASLPGDGTPFVLLPQVPAKPGEQPLADGGNGGGVTDAGVGEGAGGTTGDAIAARPGIDVTHGLLVVVHDQQADTVLIRSVGIAPQRPRRYVNVMVAYDVKTGHLSVDISAIDPALIPSEGIAVVARLTDDSATPIELTIPGRITPSMPTVRLGADLASGGDRQVTLELDIDSYPRAFSYRFFPNSSQPRIAEWAQRSGVRLTSPTAGTAFASPVETIRMKAKVDAPVGAFLDSRDELRLGIDSNRDRVFRGESPVVLRSDRQVEVRMILGDGKAPLMLATTVGDFDLAVPAGRIVDAPVNVLGHLRVGGVDTWSEPIEIVLDGRSPRVGALRVLPGRRVVQPEPIEISAGVDDDGLSGVAMVQIGFAAPGTTDFLTTAPPVEAVPTPGGTWVATIPTDAVPAGSHRLLIKATDRVGNESRPESVAVEVVSAEAMEAQKNQPKPISGVVMHGNTIAVGATVELYSTEAEPRLIATRMADSTGAFRFANVLPGTYRLRSRAVVRNNRRKGDQEVIVPEGDKEMPAIRLMVQ